MKRILTALALIPFAIYAIFFGPPWFFLLSAVAMALLCYSEYSNIVAGYGIEAPGLPGAAAGLTLLFDIAYVRLVALAALMLSLRRGDLANAIYTQSKIRLVHRNQYEERRLQRQQGRQEQR